MIIKSAEFVKSSTMPKNYPPPEVPEVAFAGRSNVGKSSLINVLVNRKGLVKVGSTPGRTQLINFFVINGLFHLVDLPGYGYAKVPQAVQKNWGPMIETYLSKRLTLKSVVMIMDIRREPKEAELNLLQWLYKYEKHPILVVTKMDKLSKSKQKSQALNIASILNVDLSELILFSSKTRAGKEKVWQAIEAQICL